MTRVLLVEDDKNLSFILKSMMNDDKSITGGR